VRNVYLVRHCTPQLPDIKRRCIGLTDLPISEVGKSEGYRLQEWFSHKQIRAVFTSPLKRCVSTAHAIADNKIPVKEKDELQELDMGAWENMTFDEIAACWPVLYEKRGRHMGTVKPPGGESFAEGGVRFSNALESILESSAGDIVVVSHAGVIRGFLCGLTGTRLDNVRDIPQPYGGITHLQYGEGAWSVISIGVMADHCMNDGDAEGCTGKMRCRLG